MKRRLDRELRQASTIAEQALWRLLRNRGLQGLKFRRQFPIRPFVADFCCYELRLIVELDGGVHDTRHQTAHDENRDIYLRSLGYEVIRFRNEEVFEGPDQVLDRIIKVAWQKGAVFSS